MALDTALVQTIAVDDGGAYDLYLPATYGMTPAPRLLVSVLPHSGDLLPRYASVALCSAIADERGGPLLAPRFDMNSGFQWLGLWNPWTQQPVAAPKVRFDMQLLAMVDDAVHRFGLSPAPFDLCGYSAGGQFAHRFLYLHPERIHALAAGAPGSITVPGMAWSWPEGLAGLRELAGITPDLAAAGRRPVMLFVGERDTSSERMLLTEAANQFGSTRVERARVLHQHWLEAGIANTLVVVPEMEHTQVDRAMAAVRDFFVSSEARST